MLVKREWLDYPEMFEAVFNALAECEDMAGDYMVDCYHETDSYGNEGSITIQTPGRKFIITLQEEF